MFSSKRADMMNMCSTASAASAEAQSFCAQSSSFDICLILDAITVASIIICLISLSALGLAGLLLAAGILLRVLAVCMIILAVCILAGIFSKFKWKHGRF